MATIKLSKLIINAFTNLPKIDISTIASGASVNFDFSNTINFNVELTQNTTFTFSNLSSVAGQTGLISIKQDGSGGHTFTLPAAAKTPAGGATIAQDTTANTVSVLNYFIANSSTVLVNYIGNFQ